MHRFLAPHALVLVMLLTTSDVMAGPVLDRIRTDHVVRIAHRDSSVPFSYRLPSGKAVGYSIDICLRVVAAIERKLGRSLRVEYVPVTPANRIDAILNRTADLECGSTTSNGERRQQVAFTIPTFIATSRLMVRSGNPVPNIWNASGKKVVTTRGTSAAALLRDLNENRSLRINVIEATDHAAAFSELASGNASAFLMDDVLLAGLRARSSDPARYLITGRALSIEPLSIMFNKDDPELKALVDSEVRGLITSGDIRTLYRRWFEMPIPPDNVNLELPMSHLLSDSFRAPTDWLPN